MPQINCSELVFVVLLEVLFITLVLIVQGDSLVCDKIIGEAKKYNKIYKYTHQQPTINAVRA